MTIESDFRFAIFDRGENREEVAAKNAKNTKMKTFAFVVFAFFAAICFGRSRSLRLVRKGWACLESTDRWGKVGRSGYERNKDTATAT